MKSRHAFTLLELLIVIIILAFLTVSFLLLYPRLVKSAQFQSQKAEIVNMIQKVRSLSLSTIMVSGGTEPTFYYNLVLTEDSVSIIAYSATQRETIETLKLGNGVHFEEEALLSAYYFPPYGEVCFDRDCTETSFTTQSIVLFDEDETSSSTFTLDMNGGYVTVD